MKRLFPCVCYLLSTLVGLVKASEPSLDLLKLNAIHEHYCPTTLRCSSRFTNLKDEDGNNLTLPYISPNSSFPGSPTIDGSCCGKCSCDLQTCALSGTCCPDTLDHLASVQESRAKQKTACEYAQLRQPDDYNLPTGISLHMVTKCADDFDDPLVSMKCEDHLNIRPWDIQLLLPVSDLSTGITYRNRYCAVCHHIDDNVLESWGAKVQCSNGKSLYTSGENVIEEVMNTRFCNMLYTSPDVIPLADLPDCEVVISECNVTGKWKVFDPFLQNACHAYEAVFDGKEDDLADISTWVKYRNVFCFLCNEVIWPLPRCTDTPGSHVFVSFSAILHLNSGSPSPGSIPKPNACTASQTLDPLKRTCKDVTCLPPKVFLNGNCRDTFATLSGVLLDVFIKVIPMKPVSMLALPDTGFAVTNKLLSLLGLDLGFPDIVTTFDFYYNEIVQLNKAEQVFGKTSAEYLVFHIQAFGVPMLEEDTLWFLNKVLKIDGRTDTIPSNEVLNEDMETNETISVLFELGLYSKFVEAGTGRSVLGLKDGRFLSYFFGPMIPVATGSIVDNPQVLVITKTMGCPLVDISDYPSESLPNGDLLLKALDYIFPANAYTRKDGNASSVLVCRDDFIPLAEKQLQLSPTTFKPTSMEEEPEALGILSLVCVVLSLICLFLTLLTYLLFKNLRKQPGINNMCLVLSLIIAQSLYQFGVGQADQVPAWGCQTLGVLIHFFWLMSVFWMNVCSYHMFRVFTTLTRISRGGSVVRRTFLYSTYCFTASAVFVAINLVVSSAKSNRTAMGYGGTLCYVSDYFMNLYTFAIPVGIVVLVNIALFISVIVNVTRMPTVDTTTERNRNYVKIYTKLSCLIGVSWVFGFLVYTDVVVFEYLFIIFTAGQGVFIFTSFVCTRRVIKQYSRLVRRNKSVKATPKINNNVVKTTEGTPHETATTGTSKNVCTATEHKNEIKTPNTENLLLY